MLAPMRFFILLSTTLLVFAFTYYLNFAYYFDVYNRWLNDDINNLEKYDYIVVGAGSAGATLAGRLADNGYKTLLLEAGASAPPFIDIPLIAPLIQASPYNWRYTTVPQHDACKGLINNQSRWPMGKILGGSSRMNYMLYVRGHPSDYDKWLPDFVEPIKEKGGPMQISDLRWNTEFVDVLLDAVKELNQLVDNINRNAKTGFMKAELAMENGKRWSTDKLLYQNSKRTLKIITHAHVHKVLFESDKAVGVQFVTLNQTFQALAKSGVIISAGVIGSPKILMLSGIGPRKHLEDLKINVIKDLPVGQHLVDHILTGLDLITLNVSYSLSMVNALNPVAAFDYFFHGKGPWTSAGIEVIGTFHSSFQKNKTSMPDLQIMMLPLGLSKDNGLVLKEAMGIPDKIYNEYFAPLAYGHAVTIAPVLLHPKSSGEIKLKSADPFDAPLIDPKYLSNKDDIATLIDGIFVLKLVETNAMKAVGASVYKKHYPGCEDKIFGSTEYWECYVQHLTLTSYHPAGTCRMGEVVDSSFRVYGIQNLFVVDASVFPSLPSGNINAAVIMTAEKAARIFKQSNECHKPSGYCDIFRVCGSV